MYDFKDKRIVITGGNHGIGLAAALAIVEQGGHVLVTGSNKGRLEAVKEKDERIHILQNDAADLSRAELLSEEAKNKLGRVDGLFLNAGKGARSPLGKITPEQFDATYRLNVGGPLFQIQALLPLFPENGGSIVITASTAAHKGYLGNAIYSGTKGAVVSMVRSLALDLIPQKIRVNSVSPGPIATGFFDRLGGTAEMGAKMMDYVGSKHPMGRLGTPAEAAAVALFLLSDQATFVTAADYLVDGGDLYS